MKTLHDLPQSAGKHKPLVSTSVIIDACERAFGLPAGSILSAGRGSAKTARARALAAALACHRRNGRPFWEVAADFGKNVSGKWQRAYASSMTLQWRRQAIRYCDQSKHFREMVLAACKILNDQGLP